VDAPELGCRARDIRVTTPILQHTWLNVDGNLRSAVASLSNLVDREFARNVRQIGTNRLSGAVRHVAGTVVPLAKEKLLSSGRLSDAVVSAAGAWSDFNKATRAFDIPIPQGKRRHAGPP
jgi:hypothetical protein